MKIKLTKEQYKLIKEQGIKTPSGDIIGAGGIIRGDSSNSAKSEYQPKPTSGIKPTRTPGMDSGWLSYDGKKGRYAFKFGGLEFHSSYFCPEYNESQRGKKKLPNSQIKEFRDEIFKLAGSPGGIAYGGVKNSMLYNDNIVKGLEKYIEQVKTAQKSKKLKWSEQDVKNYEKMMNTFILYIKDNERGSLCEYTSVADIIEYIPTLIYEWRHTILDIAALVVAFVPVVGIFIAAGIELGNAYLYYKEEDNLMAAIAIIFAALPLIGTIPGVKQLTGATIKKIVQIAKSGGNFTADQWKLIKKVLGHTTLFQKELGNIKSLKKEFLEKSTETEYRKLFKELLEGKKTKEEFIAAVKSPVRSKIKRVVGIKVPESEKHVIESAIQSKGFNKAWGYSSKTGEPTYIPIQLNVNGKTKTLKLTVSEYQPHMINFDKLFRWSGYDKFKKTFFGKSSTQGYEQMEEMKSALMKLKLEGKVPPEIFKRESMDGVLGVYSKSGDWIIIKPQEGLDMLDDILYTLEHEIVHVLQPSKESVKLGGKSIVGNVEEMSLDGIRDSFSKKIDTGKVYPKGHKWEGKPIMKSAFSKKEKADAYRLAFAKLYTDYPKSGKMAEYLSAMTDDEVISLLSHYSKEGKGALKELTYLLHQFEIEAEFTPFISSLIKKGQQSEYKGLITSIENYLRTGNKETLLKFKGYEDLPFDLRNMFNKITDMQQIYPKRAIKLKTDLYKQIQNMKKAGYSESFKRKRKITLTESQYKKVLLREFGEVVRDPKQWYLRVLEWVDSPEDLDFQTDEIEVVVYDKNGSYLGYYDKDQDLGFVVTEYGIGLEDDEEYIDEQEEGGESSGGGSMSKWDDLVSPVRGPDNTLDNSPWSVSPQRGPDNTLDNSPWSVSPVRGPANTLT